MKQTSVPIAKISPPSISEVFTRKRLFKIIDSKRRRPVIWICGPPGAGKSTLVASYLKDRKLPSLWYRLDEGDNDIGSFFYFMGLAANRITSSKAHSPLPLFSPEYLPALSTFTRRYFRELYGRLKRPSVMVLDDYHEVPAPSLFHHVIWNGIEDVIDGISIIIVSRHDPPALMARPQARGMLEIIGRDVLNLTMEESRGIVWSNKPGKLMSEDMIRHLHKRSGGWTAGLVLLLREGQTVNHAAEMSTMRAPEVVFDYLAGEIFNKSNCQTKDFLLKTAFLPMMTIQMANEIAGIADAKGLLSSLHRDNCFTEKSSIGSFYEYHTLFREFLISRAEREFSREELFHIKQNGARLLESSGQAEEAVSFFIEAGDWDGATRVILNHAPELTAQRRGQTLTDWLTLLPQEITDKNPWLLYWRGVCYMLINSGQARDCFERVFSLFCSREDKAGIFLSWCGVVDTIFHSFNNFAQLDPWIALLDEMMTRYPVFPSYEIESRVTYTIFEALLFRNQMHPDFHRWAEKAFQIFQKDHTGRRDYPPIQGEGQACPERIRRGGDGLTKVFSANPDEALRVEVVFFLVFYCHLKGEFARASILIHELRESTSTLPEAPPLSLLVWKAAEAFHYWLTGSKDTAIDAVNTGLLISRETGVHHMDYILLGQGISCALSSGDMVTAKMFLREMVSVLNRGTQNDRCFYYYLVAWDAMLRGDIPHAIQHAETSLKQCGELGAPWQEFLSRLLLTNLLHEKGDDRMARANLSRAKGFAGKAGSPFCEYMYLLTNAWFLLNRNNREKGLNLLRQAMSIGREKGLVNFWGWRSDVMSRLCATALEAGIEVDYVRELILKRGLTADPKSLHIGNWPWPLKVYTMGRFSIKRDGELIRFTGKSQRKPMEMLKVLITLGGRNIKEDKMRDTLWPEADDEDAAHSSFTTTLSRLRKLIGQEAVTLSEGMLSLNPRYCWVDVWVLERLLTEAETSKYSPTLLKGGEGGLLDNKLIRLYHGPFLCEEESNWALPLRERLSSKFIRYIRTSGRLLEQAGEYEQAITLYQKGIEADPLAEGLYRCLMACYHTTGSHAEAAAVYRRCQKTLSAMLGILPSAKTDGLYLHIKNFNSLKKSWQ
ncbi:MAG: hypothetical protein IT392_04780 [Nitrospirae bacterium]|nr:hypothetical protein [Nitrospirota bacterium]